MSKMSHMSKQFQSGRYGLCLVVVLCLLLSSLALSHGKDLGSTTLELREKLSQAQKDLGTALYYTSAYRPPTHPIEALKPQPGTHARGVAVDIACNGTFISCDTIYTYAKTRFDGIGRYDTHIHLDLRGYPARWDQRSKE